MYLGQSWSGNRQGDAPPVDPPVVEKLRVVPTITAIETNAEPFVVRLAIPPYGEESEPLRAIHVVVVPAGDPRPETAEGWLALGGHRVAKANLDVTGVFDTVSLSISGLFGGPLFLQTILEAGSD